MKQMFVCFYCFMFSDEIRQTAGSDVKVKFEQSSQLQIINVSAQVSLFPEDAYLSINQSESIKIQLQARLS